MANDQTASSRAALTPAVADATETVDAASVRDDACVDRDRLAAIACVLGFGEAVAGSIHDFNNSLQVVGGVTELLLGRDDLPDPVVEKLERIEHQTTRAAATILALQALTRPSLDERVALDLEQLAFRTLALRHYRLSKAGITARIEAPPGQRYEVVGDGGQLQHALLALVLNAEHAMRGQAESELVISLERHADLLVVIVRDSGSGVPDDLRETVFEPWFSTQDGAAGLGLWLVRETVTAHGGTVSIERNTGSPAGAAVRLEIPAAP